MQNKGLKIFLATLCSAIILAAFIALCVCTYKFNWNKHAFWWPWAGILFIIDFVGAWITFHNKNKSDENKTFWLFMILSMPFVGFIVWLFFGRGSNVKDGSHPNNSLILKGIFEAKKSITICVDSFFPPFDVFDALKFASNSNKEIKIIVSNQRRKFTNELMHQYFERKLSRAIKVFFTDNDIMDNFIIIDDAQVIVANKNFNYKNVFNEMPIFTTSDVARYSNIAQLYEKQATFDVCQEIKRAPYKRLLFALANIFYIIF